MGTIYINGRFLTQRVTGVQRYAREIVTALDKLIALMNPELSVELLVPAKSQQIVPLRLKNIRVRSIGNFTGHLWEQVSLPSFLIDQEQEYILLGLTNTGPLAIHRQILVIHDAAFFANPKWFSWKFSIFYRMVVPLVARKSLRVITDSEFSREELVRYMRLNPESVDVIYSGVTPMRGSGLLPNIYGITNTDKYLLGVSSIDPRKNLLRLISAFKRIDRADIKLVIVGSRNSVFSNPEIDDGHSIDSRIVFTGYIPDESLAALYQKAFLFVYPSLYEGFGLPPLEAMTCGCPVLTSNVASLPEVCGDAAIYVDPYDLNSITNGITYALSNEDVRADLIKKGYVNVKRFAWMDSAEKILKILRRELR